MEEILQSGEIGIFKYFFAKIPFSPPTDRNTWMSSDENSSFQYFSCKIFADLNFLSPVEAPENYVDMPSMDLTELGR